MTSPHKYTNEQESFLKNNVKGITSNELTTRFNTFFKTELGVGQIRSKCKNLGIKSGITTRFQKGQEAWNRGRFGISYEGSKKTQFKKGNLPHNHKPIGTETIDKDGYHKIKVSDDRTVPSRKNWKYKHVLLWEEHNGPIPKGNKVIFLDRNRENITIENLALVSDDEMLLMNKKNMIHEDPELTKTSATVAKLIRATYKRSKKEKEK